MQNIIISPIITEKSMKAGEGGKYSFIVSKLASKTAIKEAVGSMFKVSVINVQTSIVKGRQKRNGARRIEVTAPSWKKAIVKLKKGEKIGLFEPGGAAQPEDQTKGEGEKKEKEKKKAKK